MVLCFTFGVASATPAIRIDDARRIALTRVPGTIVHEKLKKVDGKKGKKSTAPAHDHYNIKIRPKDHPKADRLKRVEIDAVTGQVLEVKDVKAKSYDKD